MGGLQDDERLAFMGLAICDALEQQDDTKAREALAKARRHAHAVINRGHRTPRQPETDTPGSETAGDDEE